MRFFVAKGAPQNDGVGRLDDETRRSERFGRGCRACRASGARDSFFTSTRTFRSWLPDGASPALGRLALTSCDGASRWIVSVARASGQKRWQSHRTPKVLGGAAVADGTFWNDFEFWGELGA
jgi:hypothetical protein